MQEPSVKPKLGVPIQSTQHYSSGGLTEPDSDKNQTEVTTIPEVTSDFATYNYEQVWKGIAEDAAHENPWTS